MATVKNWNNKAALLRQQALAGGTKPANPAAPIDPKIYKANLEDFVDRVMFKGDMDYLDDTSKKQITADIDALVTVQGDQAKTNTGFKKLALTALTSRTTKPGVPAQAAQPAAAAGSADCIDRPRDQRWRGHAPRHRNDRERVLCLVPRGQHARRL
jgi:hypothetical protein